VVLSGMGTRNVFQTRDFLRAAQDVVQYGVSINNGPISNSCGAEMMLLLVSVSRKEARDVVSEEQNIRTPEVTVPKE